MRFDKMENVQADQLDFVPRERRGFLGSLIIGFVGIACTIFIFAYLPALSSVSAYTPLIAVLLVAFLCLYVVYKQQINLDLIMATEFQNMLYSQALSIGSSFTLIVRRDGNIVHTSDNLDQIFPQFNYATSQALEGVFEEGTVRKIDRERIMGAIYSGSSERLVFPIISKYTERKDYIITVEAMPRPAGYCLIRGREYHGQRTGLQVLPDALRTTSFDKLDHLLTTTTTGHYTTDQYGRFEYVNPAFEFLLGYAPNEIIENKLGLHHLFFSFNGQALTEEYAITDYNGPAIVVTKSHGRQPAEIRQSVIRDGNGKAFGATGSLFTTAA